MTKIRIAMSFVLFLLVGGILTYYASTSPQRSVQFSILHTSDIHADFNSTLPDSGIVPQLLYMISQLRKQSHHPMLWIDTGDLLYGPGSGQGRFFGGKIMSDWMRTGKCDIFIPGNHEFDEADSRSFDFIKNCGFKHIVSANLHIPELRVDSYVIYNYDGYKVGVTGLTPHISNPGSQVKVDTDLIATLVPVMAVFQNENVDFIVLGVHQGRFGGDVPLATIVKYYPQIHLVLSGHVHQYNGGEILGRRTFLSQSRSHAEGINENIVKDFTQNVGLMRSPEIEIKYHPVPPICEPSPLLDSFYRLERTFDTPWMCVDTGKSNRYLERKICRAARVKNMAFFIHALLPDTQRIITQRDLLRVFLYDNALWRVELARDSFIELAKDIKISTKQRAYYLRFWKEPKAWILFDSYTYYGRDGKLPLMDAYRADPSLRREKISESIYLFLDSLRDLP